MKRRLPEIQVFLAARITSPGMIICDFAGDFEDRFLMFLKKTRLFSEVCFSLILNVFWQGSAAGCGPVSGCTRLH